jgi:acetyl-CoA synthetase
VLKAHGVKKGDRVTIYLPMIPEAAYAMLACARIGAVHSVVFGGFSPDSARQPHQGRDSARHHRRRRPARRQAVPLKANVDAPLDKRPASKQVIVVKRTGAGVAMQAGPRRLV